MVGLEHVGNVDEGKNAGGAGEERVAEVIDGGADGSDAAEGGNDDAMGHCEVPLRGAAVRANLLETMDRKILSVPFFLVKKKAINACDSLYPLRRFVLAGRTGGEDGTNAGDDIANGLECSESVVGDLDIERLLDLEGNVYLVEGVDGERIECALERDGLGRNALRFGDDVNATLRYIVLDFVHSESEFPPGGFSVLLNLQGGPGDVKWGERQTGVGGLD